MTITWLRNIDKTLPPVWAFIIVSDLHDTGYQLSDTLTNNRHYLKWSSRYTLDTRKRNLDSDLNTPNHTARSVTWWKSLFSFDNWAVKVTNQLAYSVQTSRHYNLFHDPGNENLNFHLFEYPFMFNYTCDLSSVTEALAIRSYYRILI